MNRKFFILSGVLFSLIFVSHAYAATVTFSSVTGGGLGSGAVDTVAGTVNNDNANPSDNLLGFYGDFDFNAPIDFVFAAVNSGGTTEYYANVAGFPPNGHSYDFTNDTGISWIGFQIFLGFETGDDFIVSNDFDFLDFDAPERDPTPNSNVFDLVNHGPNVLSWLNGNVADGEQVYFNFSFDVPDPNAFVPQSALTGRGYDFTLRFLPFADPNFEPNSTVIPEPSTFALIGMGLVGLLTCKKLLKK